MNHGGLYFTREHVQMARSSRTREPFQAAFAALENGAYPGSGAWVQAGCRWKILEDVNAGALALLPLEDALDKPPAAPGLLGQIMHLHTAVHAFELLRDHPHCDPAFVERWLDRLAERVEALSLGHPNPGYIEWLWMGTLYMAAGIALERPAVMALAVETFETAIREDVRPQGFIPNAVKNDDGRGLERQVLAASALVLMAEAAAHSGEPLDLWGYAVRGVTAVTAAIYPIYYFYTTQKWAWDADLPVEAVQAVFRQHGGYLEIVHRRTRLKDLYTVLTDLRPVVDIHGGGFTTLTHGLPVRKGLFG
ncbi:MAG: alginate lyase family protein [bacterium]|nr:alginate lyase family protein [bacterium]